MMQNMNSIFKDVLSVINKKSDIQESHFTYLSQLYQQSTFSENTQKILELLNEKLTERFNNNLCDLEMLLGDKITNFSDFNQHISITNKLNGQIASFKKYIISWKRWVFKDIHTNPNDSNLF